MSSDTVLAAIESLRQVQARDSALIREVLEGLATRQEFDAAIVALAAALKVIDDDQEARWNHLETQLAAIAKRMTEPVGGDNV
jgi:hypothetical protein